jgi:hypothetical protein
MMRQPIRKVKLFFPKLRDQEKPPTHMNTIPIDEQINTFIDKPLKANNMRKIVDVKYEFQYIINDKYEGEFERALLIYEEEA